MHKRAITYTDYDDNEVTDVFYFHISEPELIDLEVENEKGLQHFLRKIIETKDNKALVDMFKKLVLMSYGVKSDDGKRFIKNDQLRTEFSQTAAYNKLFMDLALDFNVAAEFIKGILPKSMTGNFDVAIKEVAAEQGTTVENLVPTATN